MPGVLQDQFPSVHNSMAFWCCFYAAGVIGTLAVYGVLQERLMTIPYGGKLFTVSTFLVFSNRVFNCAYAYGMMVMNKEEKVNQAPIWKYMVISFSNVAATTCQYEALKYVSFPVQMLGKSFKMMPVMIWGIVIRNFFMEGYGKPYALRDWIIAACVTFGVTEFLLTGNISAPTDDGGNSLYGLLLLVGFLACDGLTSTTQELLFKQHKTTKFNQILYVNACSAATSMVALLLSNNLSSCIAFFFAHSDFALDVMILSSSAAASQYFIYAQIQEFGALVFAATMNVRQVVSIIVSCIQYHHVMTWLQTAGLFLVFGALFYKSYVGLQNAHVGKGEEKPLIPSKAGESDAIKPASPQEKV